MVSKDANPLLQHPTAEDFAQAQLTGLQPYLKYYAFMGRINTLGPEPLPEVPVPELTPEDLLARLADVQVVDARPRAAFAAGHVPGSLGIELADDFGTWVGWLVPFNAPIVLVLNANQDFHEAVVRLQRIGFDRVQGVLLGVGAWQAAGFETSAYDVVDVSTFARTVAGGAAPQILDVRSPAEYETGSIPGAHWRYVPDLVEAAPAEPVWVVCASGFRASIAAGLLERQGYTPLVLADGAWTTCSVESQRQRSEAVTAAPGLNKLRSD